MGTLFNPKFTITNKINKGLIEIERVRGFLDAVKLKEDWFAEMQHKALILESHYSTHIEGTALTIDQAEKLLKGKDLKNIDPEDKKELLNYRSAMDFVSKYLGKKDPVTEGLIREMHKITVKGVRGDKADPGKYRNVQNWVINSRTRKVIYTPPSPFDVPNLMKDFILWLNQNEDLSPVLISGISQFQFVHIHPFLDGNGRTARLLSTLILYKTGYDFKRLFTISEYYDKNRPDYYSAIQSVRKNDLDMTFWLEYFVEGLKSQMVEIQNKGERIIKADNIINNIKDIGLNDRQQRIIRYTAVNGSINNKICQDEFGIIKRTATRDLAFLSEKGILKKVGNKKGTFYVLENKGH